MAAERRARRGRTDAAERVLGLDAVAVAIARAGTDAVASPRRAPAPPGRFTVTFLDVGQGDATLLQAPGGHASLVDGGPPGSGVVGDAARPRRAIARRRRADARAGGPPGRARGGARAVPVRLLLDGGPARPIRRTGGSSTLARRRGTGVVPGAAGQRCDSGACACAVLSPPPPARRALDAHGGPEPARGGLTRLLRRARLFLPADAESDVTGALALPPVDVLKVAHHGSADEGLPALLERLRPSAAVIEVGAATATGTRRRRRCAPRRGRRPRLSDGPPR